MEAVAPWMVDVPAVEIAGLDLEEMRRALQVFTDTTNRWELRALGGNRCGGTRIFDPDGTEEMLVWSRYRASEYTVYLNVNPVHPSHRGATALKSDMAGRHWLFLDIDPVKADGHEDDSATDEEHEQARECTLEIHAFLGEQDWPAPVVVDSGNGFYLLYRVDLPNTEHVQSLFKRIGQVLHERFKSAKVDRSVHNVNRLVKLPGSMARKGQDTPDRPHRMCRLVHVPEHLLPVPAELLAVLAGDGTRSEKPVQVPGSVPSAFRMDGTHDGHARYVQRAIEGEVARVALARRGAEEGLKNALNRAAFALGQFGGAGLLLDGVAYSALVPLAVSRGLGQLEADRTFRSGWESGKQQPRKVPERNGHGPSPVFGSDDKVEPGQKLILRASEVVPKRVEWLWPWRIPLGKLTTFAGIGGLGKTFVLCDLIARISRGMPWPDLGGECAEVGQSLFVSGEDDPEDTLVPRLIELGADLNKVAFLTTEVLGRFTLADLKTLDRAVDQIGTGVRFVAIDPPTAYLGKVDDHKNAELRSLLTPLAAWAASRRLAIVFNTHVSKPQGKVEAMMRVMGSVAWVNAVRAGHMFARDPEDPEKRVFVPMKSNLGKPRKGLSYRILELPNDLARVEWLGEVETTADQAVNSEKGKPRKVVARDWLVEAFRARREWPSDELFRAAKEAGVSRSAIFEAKNILDLPPARRSVAQDGSISYHWWVPSDWSYLSGDAGHTEGGRRYGARRHGKDAACEPDSDETAF